MYCDDKHILWIESLKKDDIRQSLNLNYLLLIESNLIYSSEIQYLFKVSLWFN